MAKKQVIRLTEGELHNIIKESVNKVLNESWTYKDEQKIISQIPYLDDNELEDIINGKYEPDDFEDDYTDGFDECRWVIETAQDEYAKRHKDYALKLSNERYKNQKSGYKPSWYRTPSEEFQFHPDKEGDYYKALDQKLRNDDSNFGRFNDWIKKEVENNNSSNFKRGINSYINKRYYNGRNPDTQKLHTKGSLNRELRAMDKAKK